MSDSETEESDKPGCSDSESGHPGQTSQDSQKQLGNKMFSHSVDLDKISVSTTGGNIELKPPSRSAHQQGNRGGLAARRGRKIKWGKIYRDLKSHDTIST